MMAVPPLCAWFDMGDMYMNRPYRFASLCTSAASLLFILCSCIKIADIGRNLFSVCIDLKKVILLIWLQRPFGFQVINRGPGCGSIPSSVRSRTHSGHGMFGSLSTLTLAMLSALYRVRCLGLGCGGLGSLRVLGSRARSRGLVRGRGVRGLSARVCGFTQTGRCPGRRARACSPPR
jgi:hypothetical protein